MADKLLKSIKFPTLPDRYVIGDTSLTEEGAAADAKAVGDALAKKADTSGTYGDLVAGGAEQLMADGYESDSDPYLFRPTGGSADVGNREYVDKIVGGTVAWNQLVDPSRIRETRTIIEGATLTNNGDGSITITGTLTANATPQLFNVHLPAITGHVYLWQTGQTTIGTRANVAGLSVYSKNPAIFKSTETMTRDGYATLVNGETYNVTIIPQFIDLTAMFGSTIADYIYSLEQSQAGAGVAWFRNYFPKDYYPYDKGTLRSVEGVSAHETVGFNQWDEEWEVGDIAYATGQNATNSSRIRSKNYIHVIPNATYYVKASPSLGLRLYDEDKNYIGPASRGNGTYTIPSNVGYIRFIQEVTTYNHDICINLSDPSRNGEYEPYVKHTYPLDSSLTLRGVPKLADGKLAFDGDVYPPSGDVQRRYGLRAYQSGDESLTDAITDGTNTVYKLATPTTETAEGYEHYQICDPSGTEEFVTTGIVPVGHETRYPHDLKKKIETAPDSPSSDGTYLMKRSGGKNTYMALPSTPSANGAYVLTVTVSGGSASYSWAAKE